MSSVLILALVGPSPAFDIAVSVSSSPASHGFGSPEDRCPMAFTFANAKVGLGQILIHKRDQEQTLLQMVKDTRPVT